MRRGPAVVNRRLTLSSLSAAWISLDSRSTDRRRNASGTDDAEPDLGYDTAVAELDCGRNLGEDGMPLRHRHRKHLIRSELACGTIGPVPVIPIWMLPAMTSVTTTAAPA